MVRHWWYILLAAALAVAAGYIAVHTFGKKRYSYQGKLFYSPNRVTEPYYVSPSLRDLQLAIVETPFLRSIHKQFDVAEDFLVFAYRIGFDVNGSSSLDVSYTGRDPDHTQKLVQGSMQRFVDRAKELRQNALSGYVDDFSTDIARSADRYQTAKDKLAETLQPLGLQSDESLTAEIGRLRNLVTTYESSLDAAKMRRDLSEAQVETLAKINALPEPEATASSDPSREDQPDADAEETRRQSLATYDTQMQKLLEDRIRREREDGSLQLQIDLKKKEYERSKSSYERDLISAAAFEKVKGELQLLEAQKSSRIRELESQLSQINSRINDRTESLSVLDPATAATLMTGAAAGSLTTEAQTMALLKGSKVAAEMNIDQLNDGIGSVRAKLVRLVDVRQSAAPLIAEVESAAAQLNRLRDIRDEFARAREASQAELSIAQDATRLLEGEKNNYTKWFLAAALAVGGLMVGPLFGYEFLKAWKDTPESATLFGLPVLGRRPSEKQIKRDPAAADKQMRRLALRVANVFGRRDGVLAIIGGQAGDENDDLIQAIADHFRGLGTKVSITDASDLVAGSQESAIARTWLDQSQQGGGLTLIRSPLTGDPLIGDTAASDSDAALIIPQTMSGSSPTLQRRIAELSALGTRVIGVVGR